MAYFTKEEQNVFYEDVADVLVVATAKLHSKGGLINSWTFRNNKEIVLMQGFPCGVYKEVGVIPLEVRDVEVFDEDEFANQIEDMMLEVNFALGLDNLLFFHRYLNPLECSCDKCN